MPKKDTNHYPKGLNRRRVEALIRYYERDLPKKKPGGAKKGHRDRRKPVGQPVTDRAHSNDRAAARSLRLVS